MERPSARSCIVRGRERRTPTRATAAAGRRDALRRVRPCEKRNALPRQDDGHDKAWPSVNGPPRQPTVGGTRFVASGLASTRTPHTTTQPATTKRSRSDRRRPRIGRSLPRCAARFDGGGGRWPDSAGQGGPARSRVPRALRSLWRRDTQPAAGAPTDPMRLPPRPRVAACAGRLLRRRRPPCRGPVDQGYLPQVVSTSTLWATSNMWCTSGVPYAVFGDREPFLSFCDPK